MIWRHVAYGHYLIRHKWHVTCECIRHGLVWRGLVHDLSKFRPDEWFPYARHFYYENGLKRRDFPDTAFDFAWLLHQKRNRHHWQWWVLPKDDGELKVVPMDDLSRTEMVCDWIGAGIAQGHGRDVVPWYEKNKSKMQLHPHTRLYVEAMMEQERRKQR